jgi:hypothetical protein
VKITNVWFVWVPFIKRLSDFDRAGSL